MGAALEDVLPAEWMDPARKDAVILLLHDMPITDSLKVRLLGQWGRTVELALGPDDFARLKGGAGPVHS